MGLGKPGGCREDGCHGVVKEEGQDRSVTLLERFKGDAAQIRCDDAEWSFVCLMNWLPRCSPWWTLSLMDYCESKTRPRHLQPGSSPLPPSFLLNSRWCCATRSWDRPRRSSQATTARWPSSPWPRGSCGPQSSPTNRHSVTCSQALQDRRSAAP